jgi:hypothetical protein
MKQGSEEIRKSAKKKYQLEIWCYEEVQGEWASWKKNGKAPPWYQKQGKGLTNYKHWREMRYHTY